jgi:hypothetical protein
VTLIDWRSGDQETVGTADASDLGWRPGRFPRECTVQLDDSLVTLTKRMKLGDGEDELVGYEYSGWVGTRVVVLTVFND